MYGSDRMFILSIKSLCTFYPKASIKVILPKEGSLSKHICEKFSNVNVVYRKLSILRKSEIKAFNFSFILRFFKNYSFFRKIASESDLIYVNSIVILDILIFLRSYKGVKIVHVHEIPEGIVNKLFSSILSWSRAHLFYISDSVRRSFSLKNCFSVVLNGVPCSDFKREEEISNNHTIRLLMIGRLNSWKGQDLLLQSIALMNKELLVRLEVRIVGGVFEGQHHFSDNLRKFVLQNELQTVVTFKTFVKEPASEYLWSDVVIIPSKKPEPFGLVAIEAMSYSRPVIAANHGGLSEIIINKENGLLIEPNSKKSIVHAIEQVITQPAVFRSMGPKCKKRYEENFTEQAYMERFQSAVSKLIKAMSNR